MTKVRFNIEKYNLCQMYSSSENFINAVNTGLA